MNVERKFLLNNGITILCCIRQNIKRLSINLKIKCIKNEDIMLMV